MLVARCVQCYQLVNCRRQQSGRWVNDSEIPPYLKIKHLHWKRHFSPVWPLCCWITEISTRKMHPGQSCTWESISDWRHHADNNPRSRCSCLSWLYPRLWRKLIQVVRVTYSMSKKYITIVCKNAILYGPIGVNECTAAGNRMLVSSATTVGFSYFHFSAAFFSISKIFATVRND